MEDIVEFEQQEQRNSLLLIEQIERTEFEHLKEETVFRSVSDDTPEKKKLKRELKAEALARLEKSARTVNDFHTVLEWWDKLDANRERRERYHEVSRSGDDIPLDYGAKEDGLFFPDYLSKALAKQLRNGDFIDFIFNCPYEIHQLVSAEYLCKVLENLSDNHKKLLYLHAVRLFSSKEIAKIREQSDRNIRKIRVTMFKKIHKAILPLLLEMQSIGEPLTLEEKRFLEKMNTTSLDANKKI